MARRPIAAVALILLLLAAAFTVVAQSGHSEAGTSSPAATDRSEHPTTVLNPTDRRISRAIVDPVLLKQLLSATSGERFQAILEFETQADLHALPTVRDSGERSRQVVSALQSVARQSQAALIADLEALQRDGRVQSWQSFWIFNGLGIVTDADTLFALAQRPEIRMIREDGWRQWVEPLSRAAQETQTQVDSMVEWNINRIRADLAWSALGLDGSGVTVAIMDTGVDWQHPALQAQYRGYKPDGLSIHIGNWFCTTDEEYLYPVDGHGHGTHVTGIAVGATDNEDIAIGVAPGARWIAVKMLNDAGYGYDSWIHAAFQWILAPAGDPALAPHIVNGSWGAPDGASEVLRPDLQALRAAGIVPVFAAGNNGPTPSSIQSPGSLPEAIAVGATDMLDQVASFSSRGPSAWAEIKPEVAGPGTQIRSSLPGGSYGIYNGTSMATPHVAGTAALLLEADPSLSVESVESILESTASPVGEETPNNAAGWGRIDAYRAAAVASAAGFVTGQVTRQQDNEPLATAQIWAYDRAGEHQATVQADADGHYQLAMPPGQYSLIFEAFGYATRTISPIAVDTGLTTILDAALVPLPSGVLWGQVTDGETSGPVSALVSVLNTPASATSDGQTGYFSLALPAGTYNVSLERNGYRRYVATGIQIAAGKETRLDVALSPAPTLLLVDTGSWYYGSQARYYEHALADRDYVHDLWSVRNLATDVPAVQDLQPYDVTIWSSPLDAPGLIRAGDVISGYLASGGNLILTGQDIGFWDSGLSALGYSKYYRRFLKVEAVEDNAGRADVVGLSDDLFQGLSLPINGPDGAGNQTRPDAISLLDPRDAAMLARYADDGDAAVRASGCQSYRAIYIAAGLEGLGDGEGRAELLDRAIAWLDSPRPAFRLDLYPFRQQAISKHSPITYTLELRNLGSSNDRFALELSASDWPASIWDASFQEQLATSMELDPCQTQALGIRLMLPTDVSWDQTNVLTLTARSMSDPAITAQAAFYSKTPATVLLVDDHRWYDTVDAYRAALDSTQIPYDVWRLEPNPLPDVHSPPLAMLQYYPVAVWFTAYDWYATLTPTDEQRLSAYLNGGGRLLLSSQDYLYTSGFTAFARDYLGVDGYTEALTATQVFGAVANPIAEGLDVAVLNYPFDNWSDALRFSENAQPALWGQHAQPVALTLDQAPWKTAFFSFPLETLPEQDLADLIGRTVGWLSPLGDSVFSVDRSAAAEGEELAYTLLARNTGPALLTQVALSNTLPAYATLVPGTLQGPASYDPATRRLTWAGAIAPGDQVAFRYRLILDSPMPAGFTVRNVAHLADESGLTLDRTAKTRVNAPDLSHSTLLASTGATAPGEPIVYTFNLSNNGTRSAQVRLTDPVPLNAGYQPGTAWASTGTLTDSAELVSWTGTMAPGESVTIEVPVVPAPSSAASYILNRATLNDGWGESQILEAYAWVDVHVYFPIIGRR